MIQPTIGFIGQGWIGRNYAQNFEERGFSVVRYSLDKEYVDNKDKIKDCDIVFIAVPTPTTPAGFDSSTVESVIELIGKGKIAVIKSTVLPGTTALIQQNNPDIFVLHSPEFLTEATAAHDTVYPQRNIVGIPIQNDVYEQKAKQVLMVLPKASYEKVCSCVDAEIIKYGRNISGYIRVIFANLLYDLTLATNGSWPVIQEAMAADPDTGPTYLKPVHKSGRGAGGHCYIKDFAAFTAYYRATVPNDYEGVAVLEANESKNKSLLHSSGKDIDLLQGVYGKDISSSQT